MKYNKTKKRTVTVECDSVKFKTIDGDIRGGYLELESWKNGTTTIVRIKVTREWQLQRLKEGMNKLVSHEIDRCSEIEEAIRTNSTGDD